jgi:hypothetical protein
VITPEPQEVHEMVVVIGGRSKIGKALIEETR